MREPVVSVVVSTYDRPQRLGRLLAALRAQTLPIDAFEVIVVDNGSADATGELLRAELHRGGLQLRVVRHEQTRGPAGGRNGGWVLARAPLVAFTDDDCLPRPEWLATGVQVAAGRPQAIVQGATEPDPSERPSNRLLTRTVEVTALGPQYETCNIFYPRSILEALGGFDETFGLRPAGEDTDLAWRAIERGYQTAFAPSAVVLHAVETLGVVAKLREATRWGQCARVLAKHPPAREMLHLGVFWNVWHYLLLRSALALLGPGWLRRMIIARHMRQLRARGREYGAGAWSVPFLLVHDLVEAAAIVGGAVRYRTLVL